MKTSNGSRALATRPLFSLGAIAAVAALAATTPTLVRAQTHGQTRAQYIATTTCDENDSSTVGIENCNTVALRKVDATLNALYQKTLASLPDDRQAKLRAAETKWIAFRDADCDVYYGKDGETGTMAGIQAGACHIHHTEQRIEDLKEFAQP